MPSDGRAGVTPLPYNNPSGSRLQFALTGMAVAAMLARDAGGNYLIPMWIACCIQLPALLHWCQQQFAGRRREVRASRLDQGLTLAMLLTAVGLGLQAQSVDASFIAATTFVAGMLLMERLDALGSRVEEAITEPGRIAVLVFRPWLLMLLAGTVLLALPLSTQSSVPDYRHNFWLHVGQSAFSSVSAGCLVGISAYSYGEDYTFFGQAILFVLTQLSGMAFAALGLAAAHPFLRQAISLRSILLVAFGMQLTAMCLMYPCWQATDAPAAASRIWFGLVHASDAMWNSGWMLRTDGLGEYLRQPIVFACVVILAVTGSLGLPHILDLIAGARRVQAPQAQWTDSLPPRGVPPWKQLASWEAGAALVALMTCAACIFLWETPRFLPESMVTSRPVDFGGGRVSIRDDMSHAERWMRSVYLASTLRSAGMQSMPLSEGAVAWPTWILMLGAMLLGGSIAGTAGGMRTTTLLLPLICTFLPRLSWTSHPGGYEVRRLLLRGALQAIAVMCGVAAVSVMLLFLTTDGTVYERVFDGVSTASNVGLTTGLSLHLTVFGRISMMLLMIAGRWAPLLIWLGVSHRLLALTPPVARSKSIPQDRTE